MGAVGRLMTDDSFHIFAHLLGKLGSGVEVSAHFEALGILDLVGF